MVDIPTPAICILYDSSEFPPTDWYVWHTILTIFLTFILMPTRSKRSVNTLKPWWIRSALVDSRRPLSAKKGLPYSYPLFWTHTVPFPPWLLPSPSGGVPLQLPLWRWWWIWGLPMRPPCNLLRDPRDICLLSTPWWSGINNGGEGVVGRGNGGPWHTLKRCLDISLNPRPCNPYVDQGISHIGTPP